GAAGARTHHGPRRTPRGLTEAEAGNGSNHHMTPQECPRFQTCNAAVCPLELLAEFFGHTSAWMRDVLCDLLRKACGRGGIRPAGLPLDGGPSDAGPRHEPSCDTFDGEKVSRWTEFHEASARLPDDLRAVFDLLWYQELSQADAAALLGVAVPTVK